MVIKSLLYLLVAINLFYGLCYSKFFDIFVNDWNLNKFYEFSYALKSNFIFRFINYLEKSIL